VSRHPIYDLMRYYLTLSWARFSKDVQSHALQIPKILAHPAPRVGDLIKLDASSTPIPSSSSTPYKPMIQTLRLSRASLVAWTLAAVSWTPILQCGPCSSVGASITFLLYARSATFLGTSYLFRADRFQIALAPTGHILFYSRHPAMLGVRS
jgi:nicotinamide N-methyltransferase